MRGGSTATSGKGPVLCARQAGVVVKQIIRQLTAALQWAAEQGEEFQRSEGIAA